ncbi:hypothetical protein BD560DRAFT_395961, partial [Blakeslea trispora]
MMPMLKWASVFGLGYLCASNQIFSLLKETSLWMVLVLCGSFYIIYWPLEMMAQQESIQVIIKDNNKEKQKLTL